MLAENLLPQTVNIQTGKTLQYDILPVDGIWIASAIAVYSDPIDLGIYGDPADVEFGVQEDTQYTGQSAMTLRIYYYATPAAAFADSATPPAAAAATQSISGAGAGTVTWAALDPTCAEYRYCRVALIPAGSYSSGQYVAYGRVAFVGAC